MKKLLFMVALVATTSLNAEVSAFNAGNMTGNSYGLTANEQLLKDRLDELNNNYLQAVAKNDQLSERVEGLTQSIEGINSQYAKSNSRLFSLESSEQNLSSELQSLRAYVEESRAIQERNNKQIRQALSELSSLMQTYITNKESNVSLNLEEAQKFNSNSSLNLDENQSKANLNSDENKSANLTPKFDESWKKNDSKSILESAIKEFNANNLEPAQAKFEYLLAKNYRKARVNFYLGEIEYKQKNYAKAINYYKESANIYSKGDHMPVLLYHTAISLDKVGDTKAANGFYKALKQQYPNTPQAKAAPNRK